MTTSTTQYLETLKQIHTARQTPRRDSSHIAQLSTRSPQANAPTVRSVSISPAPAPLPNPIDPPAAATPAAAAPAPPQDTPDLSIPQPHDYTQTPHEIHLTDESLQNIERAPDGTRFFCVTSPTGTTHCAASANRGSLDPEAQSTLNGQNVDPIAPNWQQGTGHQQVARLAGLSFDETTARVGYVDGEGYGLSIEKVDDCNRNYTFKSAFNVKTNPDYSRSMPEPMAEQFEQNLETAFPPCPCTSEDDENSDMQT